MAININVPGGGTDTGDATASSSDILDGKTAYVNDEKVIGSIPIKASQTYIPSTSNITIPGGNYLSGDQIIQGDQNLIAKNIKKGSNIFGVDGTCVPLEIHNANTMKVRAKESIQSGSFVEFSGKSYRDKINGSKCWGVDTFEYSSQIKLGTDTSINSGTDTYSTYVDTKYGYNMSIGTSIYIYNYTKNTSCSLNLVNSNYYDTKSLCSLDENTILVMYRYPSNSSECFILLKYDQDKNTITSLNSLSIPISDVGDGSTYGINTLNYVSHKNDTYLFSGKLTRNSDSYDSNYMYTFKIYNKYGRTNLEFKTKLYTSIISVTTHGIVESKTPGYDFDIIEHSKIYRGTFNDTSITLSDVKLPIEFYGVSSSSDTGPFVNTENGLLYEIIGRIIYKIDTINAVVTRFSDNMCLFDGHKSIKLHNGLLFVLDYSNSNSTYFDVVEIGSGYCIFYTQMTLLTKSYMTNPELLLIGDKIHITQNGYIHNDIINTIPYVNTSTDFITGVSCEPISENNVGEIRCL